MSQGHCFSFETILDYLQGLIPQGKREEIQQHLSWCLHCQSLLKQGEEILEFLKEDAGIQVSPQAHARALNLFAAWKSNNSASLPSLLKKLVATLTLDSRSKPGPGLPLAAGLRGLPQPVAPNSPYQLLFTTADGLIEVDLKVKQAPGKQRYNLIGQVMGASGISGNVLLERAAGGGRQESQPDESFTFRFENVPSGSYLMRILSSQEQIDLMLEL